jgi:hypothetical protein
VAARRGVQRDAHPRGAATHHDDVPPLRVLADASQRFASVHGRKDRLDVRAPPGYRVADARGVSAPARDLCASGDEDVAVTPFEHLSVLILIILGLGIAQLLTNVHALAQAADRVRVYWLSVLWATLIFVGQVEWWWSSFSFQKLPLETWSFFYFLFVLLSPVTLYLAAAFVLPGIGPGERVDLRAHYYRTKGWFFAMAAAGPGRGTPRAIVGEPGRPGRDEQCGRGRARRLARADRARGVPRRGHARRRLALRILHRIRRAQPGLTAAAGPACAPARTRLAAGGRVSGYAACCGLRRSGRPSCA